jgi:tRNA (guanine-N7-)-methyltransferase
MTDVDKPFTRRIKSFVVRSTRMTIGQQRGWDAYWETLGIKSSDQRLNLSEIFGNERPVVFEIGFGMGASLFEMARDNANYNFIGVEVHRPGVGAVIASAGDAALSNLRAVY